MGVPTRVFGYRGLRLRDEYGRRSARVLLGEVRELLALWRHLRRLRPDVCHGFLFTCYTHVLPLAWAAGVPARVSGRRGAAPRDPDRVPAHGAGLRRSPFVQPVHHQLTRAARRARTRGGRAAAPRRGDRERRRASRADRGPVAAAGARHRRREPHRLQGPRRPRRGAGPAGDAAADVPRRRRAGTRPAGRADRGARPRARGEPGRSRARRAGAARATTSSRCCPRTPRACPTRSWRRWPPACRWSPRRSGACPRSSPTGSPGSSYGREAPAELAAAIETVAGDPPLRVRLGAAGRRAAERLSVDECAARHETVYRALLR